MSILVKTAWSLRLAREADISALKNLIVLSSRGLRANYYSAAQIEGALGSVFGVDRQLIRDATYFAGVAGDGQLIGCGGWSKRKTLFGSDHQTNRDGALLDPKTDSARIRAFFIHPNWARRGIATAILDECENAIRVAHFHASELAATLTGVPFYAAFGYATHERYEVPLSNRLT